MSKRNGVRRNKDCENILIAMSKIENLLEGDDWQRVFNCRVCGRLLIRKRAYCSNLCRDSLKKETVKELAQKKDLIDAHYATREIAWPKGYGLLSIRDLVADARAGLIPFYQMSKFTQSQFWYKSAEVEIFLSSDRGSVYYTENLDVSKFYTRYKGRLKCKNCKRIIRSRFIDKHTINCNRYKRAATQ